MRKSVVVFAASMLSTPDAGADARRAPAVDVLTAVRMDGPYTSVDALCHDAAIWDKGKKDEDETIYRQCKKGPESCAGAGYRVKVAPPFLDAQLLQFRGECHLAFRTDSGWWLAPDDEAPLGRFLNNDHRYFSEINEVFPTGDGAVVIRGTFINWADAAKMPWLHRPAFAEWLWCEGRVVICAVGSQNEVSCTRAVASDYTTYCRDAEHPKKPLAHPIPKADFQLKPRVTKSELRFDATGALPASAPPTGYQVPAIDAQRDDRRRLPPRLLRLRFP